jgi:SAM-dependent methyltransferase
MGSGETGLSDVPPVRLFGRVDRATWRWLNLEGREQCPFLADYLPSLPRDAFHSSISASSGHAGVEAGFETYKIIRRELRKHGRRLEPSDAVLDFGCGWGRIIRYFTRDVRPENLWGIDVSDTAIEACQETNRWARFEQNRPLPPSRFDDGTFDLIYAYSVFSHLSERSHLAWLEEFERILKPGGVFISTTLPRHFAENCRNLAHHDPESLPEWQRCLAEIFATPDEFLAAYDRGEYCFNEIAGADDDLGFAAISEKYVRRRWSRHFLVRDYFPGPRHTQMFIVARKRGAEASPRLERGQPSNV